MPPPEVPRIHLVTNDRVFATGLFDRHKHVVSEQAAVHLRSRAVTARWTIRATDVLSRAGTRVIINDRADVAAVSSAAGVHLPETGLPITSVRSLFDRPVLIGRSTHDPETARAALDGGADYVFLGPIWPTDSHPGNPGIGPEALEPLAGEKVIAIGGVTLANASECVAAGAYGVAVISAFWQAIDPARALDSIALSFSQDD